MTDTLLPINATTQERAIEGATARLSDVPVPVRAVWSPDDCPAEILPWLASQFAVDTWDSTWTEAQKRAAIASSVAIHKRKGTAGAVKLAVSALGMNAIVSEWFKQSPAGAPYTFSIDITVSYVGLTQQQLHGIVPVIDRTKNLRSHLTRIGVKVVAPASLCVAAVSGIGANIHVTNFSLPDAVISELSFCG